MKLTDHIGGLQPSFNLTNVTRRFVGGQNGPPQDLQRRKFICGAAMGVGLLGLASPAAALNLNRFVTPSWAAQGFVSSSQQGISWFDQSTHYLLSVQAKQRKLWLAEYSHGRSLLGLSGQGNALVLHPSVEKLWQENQLHNPRLSRAHGIVWLSFAIGNSNAAMQCFLACGKNLNGPFKLVGTGAIAPGQEMAVLQGQQGQLQLVVNDGSMLASSQLDITRAQVAPWKAHFISAAGHNLQGIEVNHQQGEMQLTTLNRNSGQIMQVGQGYHRPVYLQAGSDITASRLSIDSRQRIWLTGELAHQLGKISVKMFAPSTSISPAATSHKESLV